MRAASSGMRSMVQPAFGTCRPRRRAREKVSAALRLLLRAPDPAKTLKFAGDSRKEDSNRWSHLRSTRPMPGRGARKHSSKRCRFAPDSLLEEDGFEPSVPRKG